MLYSEISSYPDYGPDFLDNPLHWRVHQTPLTLPVEKTGAFEHVSMILNELMDPRLSNEQREELLRDLEATQCIVRDYMLYRDILASGGLDVLYNPDVMVW